MILMLWQRGIIGILLLSTAILAPVVRASATPLPFPDMELSWFRYREAVSYLRDRHVIRGYPDGTFKPQQTVNRAEFLKMIFASEHAPIAVTHPCFSDVMPEEWYAPYV